MIAARERRARGVARIFDVARHLQRRHPRRLLGLVVLTLLLGPRLWAWLVMLLLPRVDTVIPPRIVFTYKVNLLSPPRKLDRREGLMRDNVMKTVDMNRALRAEVVFLDDRDCDWMIQQASGLELARHFRREPLGMYKADICRGASLFLHGGWYFDVDLESLLPIKAFIRPDTDFITVHERAGNGFFQAFIGVTPRHPVMLRYLEYMLEYYQGKRSIASAQFMGVMMMKAAYLDAEQRLQAFREHSLQLTMHTQFLHEVIIHRPLDVNVVKQPAYLEDLPARGIGYGCNFVIHDQTLRVPVFYSRFVGASEECQRRRSEIPAGEKLRAFVRLVRRFLGP